MNEEPIRDHSDEESERMMAPAAASASGTDHPTRAWTAGDTAEFARIDEPDLIDGHDDLPPPPGV